MKKRWELKTLGEVCSVVNGGTPKSGTAAYWDGNLHWLTPKDMGKMAGRKISETPRKITEYGLANSSARMVPANSVILSTRAPIGHLAINEVPMSFNQGCRALVPSDRINTTYIYHYLSANVGRLNDLGTGATFKELPSSALKAFPIPLPPLEEQQRIVAILDEAFEGLDRARANAQANLKNARELFENFVTFTFSQILGDTGQKTLAEVCEFITDGTHQTPKYFDSGFLFLSAKNIKDGQLDWEDVKYVDEAQHVAMQRRLAPRLGDLLIRKNGAGYGAAALVDRDAIFDVYVSLAVLRPKEGVLPEYLLQFANSSNAQEQFKARIKGQGVPNLHLQEIRQVILPVPADIDVQRDIADKIRGALETVRAVEARYEKNLQSIADLRQSLLQKAFAGDLT